MNNMKKQIQIYLIFVLGICWILGIAAIFTQGNSRNILYQILQKGFTALPVIAAVLTRRMTKDNAGWRISLKVWKDPKLWGFCAFAPGILTVMGALLYFMLFPEQYSGVFDIGSVTGTEQIIQVNSPFQFSLICVLIAALCVPIQLLELGEEIGWREYLLPKQIELYGIRKAILFNGFYWGLANLPLIYLGFNYSLENAGAPRSNMVMMMLVCMTIGIICSYVMVRSDNVMLGPNPTGIIGMSGLIVCAAVMFVRVDKWRNKTKLQIRN